MPYTEKTGSFLSANKINNIRYRICIPSGNPKAIIQISHGMCEYFDRYENTIDYFTSKGCIVCGNDHMGHGFSVACEEDLGYFGKNTYLCFADDLYTLNKLMKNSYKALPYILIGHSMGSFIARDYIVRYPDSIDGAVICGTSGTNKGVGAGLFLSSLLTKLKGEKYRSEFLKKTAFHGYNDRFGKEDPNSWLTRDKEVRHKYSSDPKCNFTFTVSAYNNLFSLLKKVSADDWAPAVPKSLPIFIISGEDDPVGAYSQGVREVYDKLNEQQINDLRIKLYPECRHELFNEINRTEVFNDVNGFIEDVIGGVLEVRGYGR